MTWSQLTNMYGGNPLTKLPKLNTPQIYNDPILLKISDEIYKIYENVFSGNSNTQGDIKIINRAIHFTNQWINNDNIDTKIDLHGITKEGTLFWLEYQKRNRNKYSYPLNVITGRGNHSSQHIKRDISDIILTGNNSTGILEDLVYNWLKQNHQRHIKYTGNFIIY